MSSSEKITKRTDAKPKHFIALGNSLLERLNLINAEPYNFELDVSGTKYSKATMVSEAARRISMNKWPHTDLK